MVPDLPGLCWSCGGGICHETAKKVGCAILHCSEVPRSVAFYEDAFGLGRKFVHEAGMYAEMDAGGTTLSFAANGFAKSNLPCGFRKNRLSESPGGSEVALVTDDVSGA